ncbi:MAG: alpha/beta fold hydrolase, partial [Gemmatimonadales bacterium]
MLAAYLVALAGSHLVRSLKPADPVPSRLEQVLVRPVDGEELVDGAVRLTYLEWDGGGSTEDTPVIVLLHGSPGASGVMAGLGDILGQSYRVIAPDLPGFGHSTRRIPDYSVAAHAVYLAQLLDSLGVGEAHLVGFSMGSGVAIEFAETMPQRTRSITMLSAIGVQELELLGDYHLNHAIHGLQLGALWFLYEAVPHFGLFDPNWLNVPYARNFFDTDQRPLRSILEQYQGPMLVLHGDKDPLVPPAAAREHYRIVPQAEMVMYDGNHFMTFMRPGIITEPLSDFVARVERGAVVTRPGADPARVAIAAEPFDPSAMPPQKGFSLAVVLVLIALATLVSEDLATISAGLMVARGSITFLQGSLAALIGIFIGDLLLFMAGRLLGAPALERAPLKWFVRPADVERSRIWFRQRGPVLVLLSRFIPGMRLPTSLAAGALRMPLATFALWFLMAAMLWTPALVGISMVFGQELSRILGPNAPAVWPWLLGVALLLVVVRMALRLATHRGRRLLLSRWRRVREWEFWPVWLFYIPVVGYILWLGVKHRSLTLFTAANPALPDGGFVGESKAGILAALEAGAARAAGTVSAAEGGGGQRGAAEGGEQSGGSGGQRRAAEGRGIRVAEFCLLSATSSVEVRATKAKAFVRQLGNRYPVVAKPDVGERGKGVAVIGDERALTDYLSDASSDTLLQEYIPGVELGIYYYRMPEEPTGHIFGITEKRLQAVTGDGEHNLEALILEDERAMRQARLFMERHALRLLDVPTAGEVVPLGDLGNHCQGAVFLNGSRFDTPDLLAAIDDISQGYDGFYIGRYDIRAPSEADLLAGRNITVLELNGVSSETTDIYDPDNRLFSAWGKLFEQWR